MLRLSRPVRLVLAAALAVVAFIALSRWLDRQASGAASLLRPADPALLALGERVYAQQCAACHGANLEGQPNWRERDAQGFLPAPPHDASGHTWHHPDRQLFELTKYGVAEAANLPGYASRMPAYAGVLSDEEIVAVLSWIKSRWPAEIRAQHDRLNAEFNRRQPTAPGS